MTSFQDLEPILVMSNIGYTPMFEYFAPSELQHLFIHNDNLYSPARASLFNDGILSIVEMQSKSDKPCKGDILCTLSSSITNILIHIHQTRIRLRLKYCRFESCDQRIFFLYLSINSLVRAIYSNDGFYSIVH
jgi:hypothetical protein